jgi:hypothetical protein
VLNRLILGRKTGIVCVQAASILRPRTGSTSEALESARNCLLLPVVRGLPLKSVPGICVRVRPGILVLHCKSNGRHNLGRSVLANFCVRVTVRLASGFFGNSPEALLSIGLAPYPTRFSLRPGGLLLDACSTGSRSEGQAMARHPSITVAEAGSLLRASEACRRVDQSRSGVLVVPDRSQPTAELAHFTSRSITARTATPACRGPFIVAPSGTGSSIFLIIFMCVII